MSSGAPHTPVMLHEVLAAMAARPGEIIVDGTFGAGGYSRALLDTGCRVVALDRDPSVAGTAGKLTEEFAGRFEWICGRFGEMDALLAARGVEKVDGVVLDIGVSSMQLDLPERGFSFRADGPLDMRMGGDGETAADIVNGYDEQTIADILYRYGDERASRRIAKTLVLAREESPILTTRQLAALIATVVRGEDGRDPATRTFQALRIHVNDELGELERALAAAERILKPGGRLVVVVFHSLEDRIVKHFLDTRGKAPSAGSRHLPASVAAFTPSFRLPSRKAVLPGEAETRRNPRARSAKLRLAVRTDSPPSKAA